MKRVFRYGKVAVAVAAASLVGTATASAAATSTARVRPAVPPGYTVVVTHSVAAPNGVQSEGFVLCPTGTVVLGGGEVLNSAAGALRATVNSSWPGSSTSWDAQVNNFTGSAFTFDVWAVCANQPKGYLIVTSTASNPPGNESAAAATCPTGVGLKVLGGGGWSNAGSVDVNMNSSWPVTTTKPTTYSWRVQENNTSTFAATVEAFAICGRAPGYLISKGKAATIGSGAKGAAQATCPATLVPMGGGPRDKNGSVFTNINSSLPAGGNWDVTISNADSVAHSVRVYVTCAE
jgi:hypothetical protein